MTKIDLTDRAFVFLEARSRIEKAAANQTRSLDLSELGLEQDDLDQLNELYIAPLTHSLERLDLSDNYLTNIPISLLKLEGLQWLNLHGNRLSEFPENLTLFRSIKQISFSHNKIKTLSPRISNLVNLEELHLSSNKIENIPPEFGFLRSLRTLNFKNNRITELPESIKYLENLKVLDLSKNKLRTLPVTVCGLKNLEFLVLTGNFLTSLPACIENMKELKAVHLGRNKFNDFPKIITNLTEIEEISLFGNKIINIPESIGKIEKLRRLLLSDNKIVDLPRSISSLHSLKKLSLSGNNISVLPEGIGQIIDLDELLLANNNIKILPKELGNLDNNLRLTLNGNPLFEPFKSKYEEGVPILLEFLRSNPDISVAESRTPLDRTVADAERSSATLHKKYLNNQALGREFSVSEGQIDVLPAEGRKETTTVRRLRAAAAEATDALSAATLESGNAPAGEEREDILRTLADAAEILSKPISEDGFAMLSAHRAFLADTFWPGSAQEESPYFFQRPGLIGGAVATLDALLAHAPSPPAGSGRDTLDDGLLRKLIKDARAALENAWQAFTPRAYEWTRRLLNALAAASRAGAPGLVRVLGKGVKALGVATKWFLKAFFTSAGTAMGAAAGTAVVAAAARVPLSSLVELLEKLLSKIG